MMQRIGAVHAAIRTAAKVSKTGWRAAEAATENRRKPRQAEGADMMERHIATLAQKHAALEARLGEEHARPSPDTTALRALKREKLRLKDAIAAKLREMRN
jgi:hypothetical protein